MKTRSTQQTFSFFEADEQRAATVDKASLDIRSVETLTDNEKQLLASCKLAQFAPVEVWTAIGTNKQMAYSTHGVFRYFGKFPPPIATHLISTYTKDHDVVFDPMSGSGTTGVEAVLADRRCVLNDISPLSILLARVKTRHLEKSTLTCELEKIISKYRPLSCAEYDFTPQALRDPLHWFLPETCDSLRGIKFLIEKIEEPAIKDFFTVCFAAIVRRVSRATTQQGRLFLDVETAEKDALPFFIKRTQAAIEAVSGLPNAKTLPDIRSFDLRAGIPNDLKKAANLIICHPPYFNSYKYSSVNSLELSWLDFNYREVSKGEVREFFKVGKEEKAELYVDDMEMTLRHLRSALKKNGVLALMIGDTVIHNNYIPVTHDLILRVQDIFNVELVVLRAPKYTEASWAASQRRETGKVGITLYDFIILLRGK